MKRLLTVTFIAVAVMVFSGSLALSETGRIQIGKVQVLPSVTLQETYDDNIFLGNGDNNGDELKDEDFITRLKPELKVVYDLGDRGGISAAAMGDLAFYADYSDNDWQTFTAMLDAFYESPMGLFLGFSNMFTDAEDPFGGLNEYNLGQTSKRWSNDLNAQVGYRFADRYKVFGYLSHFKQDYDRDQDFTQDWEDFELGLGFQYRFLPKTWGFVRYHYGMRDYYSHMSDVGFTTSNDADFDWNRFNLGLTWEGTAKLRGELNLGYKWINADNDVDPFGNVYDDEDTWIAATALEYLMSPRTQIALNIYRAIRHSGSITYEYYEDTGISANVTQQILSKFTVTAGLGYSYADYNTNDRNDDNFNLNLGLDYQIQDWLSTGLNYTFKTKDSSSDSVTDDFGHANDYDDNQIMVYLKASY